MDRILVIGCPGAGKTYFAKALSKIIGIPVIHMDNLYWNKDKTSISEEELENKLLPYLKEDKWIIDGNYHDTLKQRLEYATDVFFLNMPRETCIEGILERIDQPRDDIPWVETKKDAIDLIEWTIDYEVRTKADEERLLKKYKKVNVHILRTRAEVNNYLLSLIK
ncbi:MAG: adenylate kinase [Bacilli bacterium]|nr:adenylate kinase [Bacilli bacterium]